MQNLSFHKSNIFSKTIGFSFVRKIGMFPKNISNNMEATSVEKKSCTHKQYFSSQ